MCCNIKTADEAVKAAQTTGSETAFPIPPDWADAIAEMPAELAEMTDFLLTHLPLNDIINYPAELFIRFAEHTRFLLDAYPRCRALPREALLHYVLFPRVNDEDISFHRRLFYDMLAPRIEGLDGAELALEVNRWCGEYAEYESQDERTASALTVFRCGSGRCGEESVFLVSALRSVGAAARQVYTPWWAHCDDNHAWVEVLCGGEWHFLGACEPEPIIDRGWFNTSASRAMLIHSRLFGLNGIPSALGNSEMPPADPSLHGKFIESRGAVSFFNQTGRYAPVRRRVFRVLADGRPACGAKIHIQLLNEARFRTIAVLTAGPDGTAETELGIGSIHCFAELDGAFAETDTELTEPVLVLERPQAGETAEEGVWYDFDAAAPSAGYAGAGTAAAALTAEQQSERERVLKHGSGLRAARAADRMHRIMEHFDCPEPYVRRCTELLKAARGNAAELYGFLRGTDGRAWEDAAERIRFIETLSEKDLRDTDADVLEALFSERPPRPDGMTEEIYWKYLASPRIENEKLTAWRGELKTAAEALCRSAGRGGPTPREVLEEIDGLVTVRSEEMYENLRCTPGNALRAACCDERSRSILFIAMLRTMGIPARLRRTDGRPEYYAEGEFLPVFPERTGTLSIVMPGGVSLDDPCAISLSRRTENGWTALDMSERGRWWDGAELTLPEGAYRLITSTRLPNGNLFASVCGITLAARGTRRAELRVRDCGLEDMLRCQPMTAVPARTPEGETVTNIFAVDGRPSLLIWLDDGGEPTEHVLNELSSKSKEAGALPVNMVFLVRNAGSPARPMLADVLKRLGNARVLLDNWNYDMENTARCLTCDPDTPPLLVVCDGNGSAVYGTSGYSVGSVELCLRIAGYAADGSSSENTAVAK